MPLHITPPTVQYLRRISKISGIVFLALLLSLAAIKILLVLTQVMIGVFTNPVMVQQSITLDHGFLEQVIQEKTRSDNHLGEEIIGATVLTYIEKSSRYGKRIVVETSWNALGQKMKEQFYISDLRDILIRTLQEKKIINKNATSFRLEFADPSCDKCSEPTTAILSWSTPRPSVEK